MKVVVTGLIGTYPVGGVVWDYGQYALGLERLGCDVYYLEDSGWHCYDPRTSTYSPDCSYGVEFLGRSLRELSPSLGQRWHFRAMDDTTYGMSADEFRDALATADVFVNVSGGAILRPEYLPVRNKVLIDTDPGWNHFRNWPQWRPKPDWPVSAPFHAHDHFFTYATRLGTPGCVLPDFGKRWHPTRPPVVLDLWSPEPPGSNWTTVMTWRNFREEIEHEGVVYGTKEIELERVEALPTLVEASLEMALGPAPERPDAHWRRLGWTLVESEAVSRTPNEYRRYVQSSRGEFSVAKNIYVATTSGWISCRSVCYLAASRPVVVQETGFGEVVPVGDGLLSFDDLPTAVDAIREVESRYEHHAAAARHVAETQFASEVVLTDMLERIGLC